MTRFLPLSLCLFSLLVLPACSALGVATGVGASVGIAAAQEGGLSRATNDLKIQVEINDLWFKHDVDMFRKLDMTVQQGRVLLTGVVQNPEHRVEAVRLAWQPDGVDQVINEIQVADSEGIKGFAQDAWISGRLRAAITFDKNVQSINYTIDTVSGVIYLMGVAQSQAELDRVIEIARTINNVKQVVSYVKIAGEHDGMAQNTASPVNPGAEYMLNEPASPQEPLREIAPYEPSNNAIPSEPTPLTNPVIEPEPLSPQDRVIESEELLWDGGQGGQ